MNKKYKTISWISVAAAVVIFILVNVFMSVFTSKVPMKVDLTTNKRYELTDVTYDYLKSYTADTTIYIVASESRQDTTSRSILDRYEAANSHIKIVNIDTAVNPSFGMEYVSQGETISENSVVVVSGDKSKIISNSDFYASSEDGSIAGLNVEQEITTALKYVSSEEETYIYFTAGHGEADFKGAKESLENESYKTADISLMTQDIPEEADMLIIARPTSDFSTGEIAKLDTYLRAGGNVQVYFNGSVTGLQNLYAYIASAGIQVNDDVIVESATHAVNISSSAAIYIADYVENDLSESFIDEKRVAGYIPYAKSLSKVNTSGAYSVSEYLASSSSSYTSAEFSNPVIDTAINKGSSSIALMSENAETGGQLFVSGSILLMTDDVTTINNFGYVNAEYFTILTNSMLEREESFVIPVKELGAAKLTMNTIVKYTLFIVFVCIIPILLLAAGIAVFFRRRNM